jgi:hypothetical protein
MTFKSSAIFYMIISSLTIVKTVIGATAGESERMFIENCNRHVGSPSPLTSSDDIWNEKSKMCIPSNLSDRWVFRYEETFVGQMIVLLALTVGYNIALPKVRQAFENFYSQKSFYSSRRMDGRGYFGPLKTELKYNSGSAFHHVCAGLLMAAGWVLQGQTLLFRLGVLTEVSIELLDIFDMIASRGLWATDNHIRPEAYFVVMAHHIPGIMLIFPLNLWCSCVEIWQKIAIAFELVGGLMLATNVLRQILDVTPWNNVCLDIFSLLSFMWARFWVATPLMVILIQSGLEIHCVTTYALIVGGFLMTVFNLAVLIDYGIKIFASLSAISEIQKTKAKTL